MACAAAVFAQEPDAGRGSLQYGFEQRVRNEIWNNITDFNANAKDDRNQIRLRTKLWAGIDVTPYFTFYAGLTSESNEKIGVSREFSEFVFDNLYFDVHGPGASGLSLRVGRQNIVRGESLILGDPSAWDGSRTAYSNAAVLAYTKGRSKLEWLAISNPAYEQYLPQINGCRKMLTEWDNRALGSYYTWSQSHGSSLEAYYFYNEETGDRRAHTNPLYRPDRFINTVGLRKVEKLADRWTATGEAAAQRGHDVASNSIRAWAAYGYLTRTFAARGTPALSFGYTALSGDDRRHPGILQGWDPLFSRGAKWGEMYIYSQIPEMGVGYWSNLRMANVEMTATPKKWMKLRTTYYHMDSFNPMGINPAVFGSGTHRGDQVQMRADFVRGANWRAHILYEILGPGEFYTHDTPGHFFRWEVLYQFQGKTTLGLNKTAT